MTHNPRSPTVSAAAGAFHLGRGASCMRAQHPVVGALLTVLTGAAVVAVAGAVLSHASSAPTALRATLAGQATTSQGTLPHAFLELATYPDSEQGVHGKNGGTHPNWVTYGPTSNLTVPAHSLVTITIKQYDTGGSLNNPYFSKVYGTVGGTATLDGKPFTAIDPDKVGHTFTLHSLPTNQDLVFISIPLPAVDDSAPPVAGSAYSAPHVVTFSFITGGKGQYVWNCEYPCGDGTYANFGGPMSKRGYMSGLLTVA